MSGIPFWSTVTRRDTPQRRSSKLWSEQKRLDLGQQIRLLEPYPRIGSDCKKIFFHDSLILNSTKLFMLLTSIIADLRG